MFRSPKFRVVIAAVFVASGPLALWCLSYLRPVCEVGEFKISRRDAQLRDQILRIYSPQESRRLGAAQLERAYTYAQILKDYGHPITPQRITEEETRIGRNSLMPETLAKIRSLFKGDDEAYRRIFVLPALAERSIYFDFFLHDPTIQAGPRETALTFLRTVRRNRDSFTSMARAQQIPTARLNVSLRQGMRWEIPKGENTEGRSSPVAGRAWSVTEAKINERQQAQSYGEARNWIGQVIRGLAPGEVHGSLVDYGERWLVVRYLEVRGDSYDLEVASFPKTEFSPWIEAEVGRVRRTVPVRVCEE